MADKSKIEWTRSDDGTPGATWNPVTGCTKVSPGCDLCYAETFAERWRGTPGHPYEHGFDLTLRPERLDQPLRWTRPRRIFVNSMSDLFHESIPDEYISRVFGVMAATPRHTYQVLTKRHGRMRSLLNRYGWWTSVVCDAMDCEDMPGGERRGPVQTQPDGCALLNVWLGVSAEDRKRADLRVPALRETPAAVRFVSAEPLIAPLAGTDLAGIDWVIAGGESGPGARPADLAWFRELRDQCQAEGVAFFLKQLGAVAGRELGAGSKGGDLDAWPADLRVREYPAIREAAA
jgi:protein gp37